MSMEEADKKVSMETIWAIPEFDESISLASIEIRIKEEQKRLEEQDFEVSKRIYSLLCDTLRNKKNKEWPIFWKPEFQHFTVNDEQKVEKWLTDCLREFTVMITLNSMKRVTYIGLQLKKEETAVVSSFNFCV
jgi:hypothetical protein